MLARHFVFALLLIVLFPGLLSACSNEDRQRKAFTNFLQTRIINKPGVHVPVLTDKEKQIFGDYVAYYAVMEDFQASLNHRIRQPLAEALKQLFSLSMSEALQRREAIELARIQIENLPTLIKEELNKADAKRRTLSQSEPLLAVYDQAYNRVITQPAEAVNRLLPSAHEALTTVVDTLDYINAHADVINLNGSMIEVSDLKVQKELNARLQTLAVQSRSVIQSQRTLINLTYVQK
ncbi:Protein of unknown function (DUF3053) [Pseudomonas duriflava]|uniref:DUF3053 family protein n=1 Tax=Pseudomonas duriflava TaxID=459528 RepID=A0A562QRB6_9PSED|nr:DUF3053 family protein [Pseudomonas duriflava]TWI58626.1 Protein of unknown function (DUF3053) [Pseudomonas duriflava]